MVDWENGFIEPSADDVAALLVFIPWFADLTNEFSKYDTTSIEPWYEGQSEEFITAAYEHHFVQAFNWPDWVPTIEETYLTPDFVNAADMETVVRLITAHIRADRFNSGHLDFVMSNGHIHAILIRLQTLAANQT